AGLLSQPEVIDTINQRFVSTTITVFDLMELGKKGDELARKVAPNLTGAVNLMFFTSEGKFIAKVNPTEELPDIHPDTSFRPNQKQDASPELNTRIFLQQVERHFGKAP